MASETARLIEEAERDGWTVTRTRGLHLRFSLPDGTVVFGSSTPGDVRSVHNVRAKLRRAKACRRLDRTIKQRYITGMTQITVGARVRMAGGPVHENTAIGTVTKLGRRSEMSGADESGVPLAWVTWDHDGTGAYPVAKLVVVAR